MHTKRRKTKILMPKKKKQKKPKNYELQFPSVRLLQIIFTISHIISFC